jgi:hypothetical protein
MNYICKPCPHCGNLVFVYLQELNCKIFRHGVYKSTYLQMNPHETRENCEDLVAREEIIGCGKPFEIQFANGEYSLQPCEYK